MNEQKWGFSFWEGPVGVPPRALVVSFLGLLFIDWAPGLLVWKYNTINNQVGDRERGEPFAE